MMSDEQDRRDDRRVQGDVLLGRLWYVLGEREVFSLQIENARPRHWWNRRFARKYRRAVVEARATRALRGEAFPW